jgi:hypothetical protein
MSDPFEQDPVLEVMKGIKRTVDQVNQQPSLRNSVLASYEKGLNAYPVDCPAKEVLARAFAEATPESRLHFVLASTVMRDPSIQQLGIRMNGMVLRLLQDENKNPVFWRACEECKNEGLLKPAADDAAQELQSHRDEIMNRRKMFKTVGALGAAAFAGEVVAGGWTEKAADGNQVNKAKIARVVAEVGSVGWAFNKLSKQNGAKAVANH